MRAGPMRHLITIEKRDDSVEDPAGGLIESWTPEIEKLFCRISNQGAREFIAAQQTSPTLTHVITTRKDPRIDVDTLHTRRLKFNGETRIFDILHAVDKSERGRELSIHVREIKEP